MLLLIRNILFTALERLWLTTCTATLKFRS